MKTLRMKMALPRRRRHEPRGLQWTQIPRNDLQVLLALVYSLFNAFIGHSLNSPLGLLVLFNFSGLTTRFFFISQSFSLYKQGAAIQYERL
jgi:hypothetical protein